LYFTILQILFTMTSDPSPKRLTDTDYAAKADAVLAAVEACLDRWLEDDVVDIDAQRSGGLLEMSFPNRSVIVLNTQAPLQELWLAARSGGHHYRFSEGAWRDTRDGRDLFEALSTCASDQAGKTLTFTPPAE
jgi:CyaY protein